MENEVLTVAMLIRGFFVMIEETNDTTKQYMMNDHLNKLLVDLGPSWWREHKEEVKAYLPFNQEKAVDGLVSYFTKLF